MAAGTVAAANPISCVLDVPEIVILALIVTMFPDLVKNQLVVGVVVNPTTDTKPELSNDIVPAP
jgi:hypothetical protein